MSGMVLVDAFRLYLRKSSIMILEIRESKLPFVS